MSIYYTIEPADREPIDYTHFDCWNDTTTWAEIARAWSATLGITLPEEGEPDLIILELLRRGFYVYESDTRVEIYESEADDE
jgi:hypothetical protein